MKILRLILGVQVALIIVGFLQVITYDLFVLGSILGMFTFFFVMFTEMRRPKVYRSDGTVVDMPKREEQS